MNSIDPLGRLRSAGRRVTDPVEGLAQQVAERVVGLVATALDVNALVARVDLNHLLSQVDLNALLLRIDLNALLARVDLNEVLQHVDVDAALDRVNVNKIAERIDMDELVEHTDLGAVIARSSGGMATEALDAARSQAVGLDQFIDRRVGRVLRRRHPGPAGPSELAGPRPAGSDGRVMTAGQRPARWVTLQGQFAGSASRFLAYAVDLAVSTALFTLVVAGISFVIDTVTRHSITWTTGSGVVTAVVFAAWEFFYFGYSWAASGKTFGMAALGIRVVRADGAAAEPWRGVLRALAFPLSFLLLGLGFLGILVQREHHALHDLIAGTAVIYAWDARAARLRFLARAAETSQPSAAASRNQAGAR